MKTPEARKTTFYLPELDLLRFGAFLLVFAFHIMPGSPSGYGTPAGNFLGSFVLPAFARSGAYGVDLFFALSAYLITAILLKEYRTVGRIDVKAFYVRRILRIWPLYYAALFLLPPILHYFIAWQHLPRTYFAAFALLAGNWPCAFWGFPWSAITPLWSVSVEEQFYLSWPLVFTSRWAFRHLRIVCLGLLGLSYATRAALVFGGAHNPAIFCNTLARLDPIALGALAASSLEGTQLVLRTLWRILLIAGRTSVLIVLGASGSSDGPRALITYPLLSFAALWMLLATIGFPIPSRGHFLVRAGIHLGRISYGLYVFHGPVIELMKLTSLPPIAWRVAAFAATAGIAWLSYRYFESPFLRLKTSYSLVERGRV